MSQGKKSQADEGNNNDNRNNNSDGDRDEDGDRNDLERVYSDQRPILNPAELADMEVLLGSKAGTYVCTYITTTATAFRSFCLLL